MEFKELREAMKRVKENPDSINNDVNVEEMRNRAMQEYLDDVAPVSEFINRSFEEIDAKRLTKKEGNK